MYLGLTLFREQDPNTLQPTRVYINSEAIVALAPYTRYSASEEQREKNKRGGGAAYYDLKQPLTTVYVRGTNEDREGLAFNVLETAEKILRYIPVTVYYDLGKED
jgi:hypothetical protein